MTTKPENSEAKPGHNSGAVDQLRSIIERIERLEAEKKDIASDIREVYEEAKSNGFDTKAIRNVIRIRKMGADVYQESQAILDTYLHRLGVFG